MTAIAGIWNSTAAPQASPVAARPMDNSGGSTDSSSTISSNDFLTLLVTEMKNQDPTSSADPNEYINQLVSVNSLEQLIQINQTLAAAMYVGSDGTSGQSTSADTSSASGAQSSLDTHQSRSVSANAREPVAIVPARPEAVTSGNLGVPHSNPAAQRVAQALSGCGCIA